MNFCKSVPRLPLQKKSWDGSWEPLKASLACFPLVREQHPALSAAQVPRWGGWVARQGMGPSSQSPTHLIMQPRWDSVQPVRFCSGTCPTCCGSARCSGGLALAWLQNERQEAEDETWPKVCLHLKQNNSCTFEHLSIPLTFVLVESFL